MTADPIIHKITTTQPYYVTQDGRAVLIRDKATHQDLQRFEPPTAWGSAWTWLITPDGDVLLARESA